MDVAIWFAIILGYISLSSKLSSIDKKLKNQRNSNKHYNLSEFVGKNIQIYLEDEFCISLKGELVSFDEKWFEIKIEKNNNIEYHFRRIDEILSIKINKK